MRALSRVVPPVLRLAPALALVCACSGGSHGDHAGGDHGHGPTPASDHRHGLTPEQQRETLLQVGDTKVTVGEFADQLSDQSPFLRARYASAEKRREFLDDMVRFELLAAEAHRLGYDTSDEVTRARDQMMIQLLMKEQFEDRIRIEDVSDDDVRAYYESHAAEFHKPPQMRVSDIRMHDRAAAQRVLAQILARRDDIAFFREQAAQNDEDEATRTRDGDLGFVSRPADRTPDDPQVPDEVANAAFALQNLGDVCPHLVQAADGFHIVKLTGKREALDRTLEDASRVIRNKLWRERREHAVDEFVAHLREEAHVQVDEHALAQIHVDLPDGGVPSPNAPAPIPGALAPHP